MSVLSVLANQFLVTADEWKSIASTRANPGEKKFGYWSMKYPKEVHRRILCPSDWPCGGHREKGGIHGDVSRRTYYNHRKCAIKKTQSLPSAPQTLTLVLREENCRGSATHERAICKENTAFRGKSALVENDVVRRLILSGTNRERTNTLEPDIILTSFRIALFVELSM